MFSYILLAALIPAMAMATIVGQCSGNKPFPNAVRVANCTAMPCDVVRGTDAIMDLDFTVGDKSITSLKPKIVAYALGVVVEYPLPEDVQNVCANLGTSQCPLDPTEEATWKFIFSLGCEYPLIKLDIEVNLLDQNDNFVSCFLLEAEVVESDQCFLPN